ncbi:hypothetical protein CDAR_274601 [Caerostris darwini]|uniref:Uncharacterized protein n=1 Tax=Caerostris darwini TaxID=1538125 RepID=A0AAV4REB5_9ARAC|nr:hypothetical protein CDAR_274601 [Caerostris darwini]
MVKQSAKSPSAAVLNSEDSFARGTPLGGRFRSPSGLSILKPIKSFWTAPGGQATPPLLTPLTVWSVCWSSPAHNLEVEAEKGWSSPSSRTTPGSQPDGGSCHWTESSVYQSEELRRSDTGGPVCALVCGSGPTLPLFCVTVGKIELLSL